MDLQELSITFTSKKSKEEVELVQNSNEACSINVNDFLDQQEWDLFDQTKISFKTVHDSLLKIDKSGFTPSCFIVRKPGYYLYKYNNNKKC